MSAGNVRRAYCEHKPKIVDAFINDNIWPCAKVKVRINGLGIRSEGQLLSSTDDYGNFNESAVVVNTPIR